MSNIQRKQNLKKTVNYTEFKLDIKFFPFLNVLFYITRKFFSHYFFLYKQ